VNGLRQHSGGEAFHVQIFNSDQSEPVHKLAGFLVLEIGALVVFETQIPPRDLRRLCRGTRKPLPGNCVGAAFLSFGTSRASREGSG